jgi:hypothetical protein
LHAIEHDCVAASAGIAPTKPHRRIGALPAITSATRIDAHKKGCPQQDAAGSRIQNSEFLRIQLYHNAEPTIGFRSEMIAGVLPNQYAVGAARVE